MAEPSQAASTSSIPAATSTSSNPIPSSPPQTTAKRRLTFSNTRIPGPVDLNPPTSSSMPHATNSHAYHRQSFLVPNPEDINPANPYSRPTTPDARLNGGGAGEQYFHMNGSALEDDDEGRGGSSAIGTGSAMANGNGSGMALPLNMAHVDAALAGQLGNGRALGGPGTGFDLADGDTGKGKGHAKAAVGGSGFGSYIWNIPRYWRRRIFPSNLATPSVTLNGHANSATAVIDAAVARISGPGKKIRRESNGLSNPKPGLGSKNKNNWRRSFLRRLTRSHKFLLAFLLLGGFLILRLKTSHHPPPPDPEPKQEYLVHPPLFGCFNPENMAKTEYDPKRFLWNKRRFGLNAGTNMKFEMECFDYSATIRSDDELRLEGYEVEVDEEAEKEEIIYHTYWRADLLPFDHRQAATLNSFLATQRLDRSRAFIWTNDISTLSLNPWIQYYLASYPNNIELKQFDVHGMTRGTPIEGEDALDAMYDKLAWVDGDAVRLVALWNHGGIWFDMDEVLIRDLGVLTEHEFVTQWDCEDDPNLILNGHIMHFRKHSPYLCELFHIMASEPNPEPNTLDWGAFLYQKLYRRLLAAGVKPFSVLPWCFTDPRNCRPTNRFPDPFEWDPEEWQGLPWSRPINDTGTGPTAKMELDRRVAQVWSIHLHNQWNKDFPKGGYVDRIIKTQEEKLKFGGRGAASP